MYNKPSRACKLAEHCVRRSSGSDCGKKTLLGIPLEAGSKRNPTDINNSRQPLTEPTYSKKELNFNRFQLMFPFYFVFNGLLCCIHSIFLSSMNTLQTFLH